VQFLDNWYRFSTRISGFTPWVFNSLENFKIFSFLQRSTALLYFAQYFTTLSPLYLVISLLSRFISASFYCSPGARVFSCFLQVSITVIFYLPAESICFLLYFCLSSFLLLCHAVFRHAVTRPIHLCLWCHIVFKSFSLLGPCVKFRHLSSCPPSWFSLSFSISTFQRLPVYFCLPAASSTSQQHTELCSKLDTS